MPAARSSSQQSKSHSAARQQNRSTDELGKQRIKRQASDFTGHKSPLASLVQSGLNQGDDETSNSSQQVDSIVDYDQIRNQTLMFFLDRLFLDSQEGKSVRSLHDLSCLFGTKDFTKEMRQIVGASRNGLKKFLESYPSLFTIEGDKVYWNQLKQDGPNGQSSGRDYTKEALEYFSKKLEQFGASRVPIRYLFGYRSQATQEVRHVSGKNIREFRSFLGSHPEVFIFLDDENVILKGIESDQKDSNECHSMFERQDAQDQSIMSISSTTSTEQPSQAIVDPYLNKRLAHLIENHIKLLTGEERSEIRIEDLYDEMAKEGNELFQKMIRDVEDLRMLIRMHPKMFKRDSKESEGKQTNFVRLLTETEVEEFDLQMSPVYQQHHRQSLQSADRSSIDFEPTSLPVSISNAKPTNEFKSATKERLIQWAEAPPFIPASFQKKSQTQDELHQHMQKRSLSNVCKSADKVQQQQQLITSNARQSLRSYLMKASASNQANYSANKQSNGAFYEPQQELEPTSDDSRTRTVNLVREASNIVTQIQSSTSAVAFDCKGYNLGLNGQITLIQFAFLPAPDPNNPDNQLNRASKPELGVSCKSCKPEVAVFDLITNPELAFCLKPLLESENIVKVVHDARNKSSALHKQFNIMLRNVFDTQVANLVIQQQDTGKPAYKSRYISINRLCEIYGDESLNKYRSLIRSKTRHGKNPSHINGKISKADANYWRLRPLTEAMIYESTMDVYCLIGGVYQKLKSAIKKEYEPLLDQLNVECVLARIKPDEIRGLKKERKTDLEVIDLRRKLFSPTSEKIVLSNREIRLLRHVELTDEVRKKIQHCPKVAKKLERLDMKRAKLAQLVANDGLEDANNNDSDKSKDLTSSDEDDSHLTSSDHDASNSNILSQKPGADALSNLMNELKDRMIETSSLLESMEDDDDDEALAAISSSVQLHSHTSNEENCKCNCHKSSSSSERGVVSISSLSPPSLTVDDKDIATSNDGFETSKSESESSKESTDMAVQCDLLS